MTHTPERTPPASQSDPLVEELALVMLRSEDPAHWLTRAEKARLYARAVLPILAAREAAAEAEGRREGIEKAAKVAESAMFNEYGRPQPVLVARLRALAEKQP